jgi:hypothetical protein
MTKADGSKTSCPYQYTPDYKPDGKYYSGYSVFTDKSNTTTNWKLYLSFMLNQKTYTFSKDITVNEQSNKNLNMTSFTGNDGEQYYIALISPQKPKVAENKLVAGIYKYNKPAVSTGNFPDPSQFSYSEVKGYTLQLDPRMPEPSMGNHSSPNNKDLIQENDGLYHGIVNYTMTGNWTLNFIMLNENGKIIKGTKVSTDFTPGVPGLKVNCLLTPYSSFMKQFGMILMFWGVVNAQNRKTPKDSITLVDKVEVKGKKEDGNGYENVSFRGRISGLFRQNKFYKTGSICMGTLTQ